jgi:imidazolonepropionase-like amidohydrolase
MIKRTAISSSISHVLVLQIAVLLCLLAVPSLRAQSANPAPSGAFVIRHARVFDGERTRQNTDVLVQDGLIKAVGADLKVPAGTREVDATGDTLLPGLIDSHTHVWDDALKQALIFGVTTELDMFSDIHADSEIRQREAAGKNLDAADLRTAGTLVTVEKGHGTEYGLKIPVLASAADAQAFVDARIAEGSDYIKIIYDDGSAYGLSFPTLSKEELAAVVTAAHKRHKLVVVHIGSQAGARDAIEAGADGLAHTFEDSPPAADFAALVKSHHAFVVPTLTVNESVSGVASGASLVTDAGLSPYINAATATNLKSGFPSGQGSKVNFANALASVKELHAAHVPILAGTDAPNPGTAHGASIHRELELLVQAGLTPEEALVSATSLPAKTFGLTDRGRIAPGLRADLLLVKGDPTQTITATRAIISVWKTGVEDDRASYHAAIEKEKAAAAAQQSLPAPAGSESDLISDFEDGTAKTVFGAGWSVTTDSIAGGKSVADMKVVDGGANAGKHSLQITGTVSNAFAYPWAGVMFSPGTAPFTPANLSAKKAIHFWAKGDTRTYRAMVFTASGGRIPAVKSFSVTPDWKEFTFPLSDFNGTDAHDVMAIIFSSSTDVGAFSFQIDDVRLD